MLLNSSIYGAVSLRSIRKCIVRPDGQSSAPSSSGPAVVGPRGVGWWTTHASLQVFSQRQGIPAVVFESITSTRSDTVYLLTQLIEEVVLPKCAALWFGALSHKDVYPALSIEHVDEAGYDWDSGTFVGKLTVPSLLPNVLPLAIVLAEQAPVGIRLEIEALVSAFVVPAAAEETGLPVDGAGA